uniref:Mediator complex subunit 27 n=1 Tax=Ovis aries TaxID=9940 RepID=A0AC11AJS9_SHEEP
MADVLSVGVNLEAFAQAISAIQALRSSVSRVFDCLKDGMRNKETLEGREKAFIAHFQDNLHSVNRDLNELERLSNLVGKPSENHPLHNSGLLSLDPVQDKTPLYSQLLQAYKWSNKKVLHSICQQIWKTQQWPQDWKRSVFIPIPKKGNAKECSNYRTIALISHVSKVMLKSLQARLQQYVNRELPDVQTSFRKGRGTRDQIANIHWIMEKARVFQKNTISALLTMTKALTVWITRNCGQF